MSTDAGTEAPTRAPCWPIDRDYLDGRDRDRAVRQARLEAYWDADIIDVDDKNKHDSDHRTQRPLRDPVPRRAASAGSGGVSAATGASRWASPPSAREEV